MQTINQLGGFSLVLVLSTPVLLAAPQAGAIGLNEVMPDNTSTIADEFGEFDDWAELYNGGATAVDVGGLYLSDDPLDPTPWVIPGSHVVEPGAHLLIWLDDGFQPQQGLLQADFDLDAGETLVLFDTDGTTVLDQVTIGSIPSDTSIGSPFDGNAVRVTLLDPTPGTTNTPSCGSRRYSALDPAKNEVTLALNGVPEVGTTPVLETGKLPVAGFATTYFGFGPLHIPLGANAPVWLLAPPFGGLGTLPTDGSGELDVPFPIPRDSGLVGVQIFFQVLGVSTNQLPAKLVGSNAVHVTLCPPGSSIAFDQALIDNAMAIPIVMGGEDFLDGGPNSFWYGRLANCITFLSIVARHDPDATDSNGASVMQRALDHLRVTATAVGTPRLRGGHASWFDYSLPLAWAIARRTPAMWDQLTPAEQGHIDLVMEHVLHTGAIFCQPNSLETHQRATVRVDMGGNIAGFVPNQSASYHSFLLASYVYFGGVASMDAILAAYDLESFKTRLLDAGLTGLHAFYANPDVANLLEGVDQTATLGPYWNVDPLGVRKTIAEINTSSLIDSIVGEEHPYHPYDPIPTTPNNIMWRWGHEWFAGAQPKSNVGPDVSGKCDGTDFGLVDDDGELRAVIPYEFDGIGMPYEFNTRNTVGGPHNRSSWDYSKWGFTFYTYMYSVTAMLGYFDLENDPQDLELYQQMRKTAEIMRFIGENKWRNSAGPEPQLCNWIHGDGYDEFAGNHWGQGLLDAIVFSGAQLPNVPVVP